MVMEVAHVKTRKKAGSTILSICNYKVIVPNMKVALTSLPLHCGFFLLIVQQMFQLQHHIIHKTAFLIVLNLKP